MPSLPFATETVTVIRYEESGSDDLGAPVMAESGRDAVPGVLVAIGSQRNASDDNRPDGIVIAYTLYFPEEYVGDVVGCDVIVRGHKCAVVGNADRWMSPNRWNMACEVSYVEG